MNSSDSQYQKGDWIVHTRCGVGQVMGIDRKALEGKERAYLKVEAFRCEYWLPVDKTDEDYIRPLSSISTLKRALSIMRMKPGELEEDHRKRLKQISEIWSDGSLVKLACLIRDLNGRQKTIKLSFAEEETLEKMKRRFVDEWIVIEDIDRKAAEEKMEKALENRLSKIIVS
jgi:RNA polymerase-interacting CarD/CdnL/TRCF family regulator